MYNLFSFPVPFPSFLFVFIFLFVYTPAEDVSGLDSYRGAGEQKHQDEEHQRKADMHFSYQKRVT
jgi:hypothetical protein